MAYSRFETAGADCTLADANLSSPMALPAFELGTFECFTGFSTALANLVLADSNIARYDSNRHGKEARRADRGLPAMTRAR